MFDIEGTLGLVGIIQITWYNLGLGLMLLSDENHFFWQ